MAMYVLSRHYLSNFIIIILGFVSLRGAITALESP